MAFGGKAFDPQESTVTPIVAERETEALKSFQIGSAVSL